MTVGNKIVQFYKSLSPPPNLPQEVMVLNPYKDDKALQLTTRFYDKFYNDHNERTILFGINPGRFGGGVTGVPFTDPKHMEDACGLPNGFEKRTELSSTFMYEMIGACGGPVSFYSKYYISAISPLGFVQDGKNLNYYDIRGYKGIFENYAVDRMIEQLEFPCNREIAYSIGLGQNIKFLNTLNKKHQLFKRIEPLPHPRWVMQYRLKRKQEFIDVYKKTLGFT